MIFGKLFRKMRPDVKPSQRSTELLIHTQIRTLEQAISKLKQFACTDRNPILPGLLKLAGPGRGVFDLRSIKFRM